MDIRFASDINQYEPLEVGMSAGCGIIIVEDRNILIGKRSKLEDYSGLWCFPGGGIESCEKPRDAIIRELKEETGFNPVGLALVCSWYANNKKEFLFTCHRTTGVMKKQEAEFDELRWVDINSVETMNMMPISELSWSLFKDYIKNINKYIKGR